MKILLISNMYPSKKFPYYGTFVKGFKENLEQEGHTFTLAVIEGKSISNIEKIRKYFIFLKSVISQVKEKNYDLIYVHYIGHSLIPLIFCKKYIKKPLVLNAHGSDVFSNGKLGKIIQRLVLLIIKKSNLLVVPSNYFKDIVQAKFGIKSNNIFVSPSGGIDTELFKPLSIEKEKNLFTIGYISRIDKGKGWDTLLDAVKILKDKKFKLKIIMIGDGKEKEKLLRKIKDLELEDIVEYLGAKAHSELPYYFNKLNVFVFPTRLAESLGLVGLEAMACGIPVIGSDIGGLSSYISNEVNGKLFEAGNAEVLANNIEYFINMDNKKFQEYKLYALKTAQRYNSRVISIELINKLEKLL